MRAAQLTLFLTLVAAAGIVLGGARIAREEVVVRTPADRVRLQEFTDAFDRELDRLQDRYLQHADRIAMGAHPSRPEQTRELCESVVGVREIHFFQDSAGNSSAVVKSGQEKARPPEIVVEGGKRPLQPAKAVVLPAAVFKDTALRHGWIPAPDSDWLVYWQRVSSSRFVAILIETETMRRVLEAHLARWLQTAFAPLRDAGELVSVRNVQGVLAGLPEPPQGPVALTVPLRNAIGSWEISAWDHVRSKVEYHPAVLAASLTGGAVLALLGWFLFRQQCRALRLAEQRVSFVNRVSHEFGAPITNVLLNLSLAEEALDSDPMRARARMRLLTEEMQRLARMVGNVLTFSRRERDALTLSAGPNVPDAVVAGVLSQFEPALKRRGIRVEWQPGADTGVILCADALAQVVGNLISNVEKYAASGEWMRVSTALEGSALVVCVCDRGPGILPSDCSRIFLPFERVNTRVNEGSSGTGLGLAIARDLATRMGGTLTLAPAETRGSESGARFELRVPAPAAILRREEEVAA